jgi:hypothetical protein
VTFVSEASYRGAFARSVAVAGELSAHGAAKGRDVREEAGVVFSPHELLFVYELDVGE